MCIRDSDKFIQENTNSIESIGRDLTDYADVLDCKVVILRNEEGLAGAKQNAIKRSAQCEKESSAKVKAMVEYIIAFEKFVTKVNETELNSYNSIFKTPVVSLDEMEVVLSTLNDYDNAADGKGSNAFRTLAKSVKNLTTPADAVNVEGLYGDYKAAKEFIENLEKLADTRKDDDLKKALEKVKGSF